MGFINDAIFCFIFWFKKEREGSLENSVISNFYCVYCLHYINYILLEHVA